MTQNKQEVNNLKIEEVLKVVGIILLGIGKSIWRSTLSVLSLIVYSYLLFALVGYYGLNELNIESFMNILILLVGNWGLFWWIFFTSNIYDEWRWRK